MPNRGIISVRSFNQAVLRGIVVCSALLVTWTGVHGQAKPTGSLKPKKHAAVQAKPNLVETPKIPGMPRIHIVPYGTPKKLTLPTSSAGGTFPYYGGPVISNVHVVEVLWGSFVDVPSTTGLPQFLTDVVNSNYFDLLSEYGTVGVPG